MSPRYDVPKAAPNGPLRLVQLFVNSIDRENGVEWLDQGWFTEHGLPGTEDLDGARAAREAIRELLIRNNAQPVDGMAIATLNRLSRDVELVVRFEEPALSTLVPVSGRPLGRILAALHAAMQGGDWSRLKACRNCRWAFFDYSRNRSATWCSMSLCGNRSKMRAFRSRHRA
jgi:predicted RNA-binding Zn ribbon-like protein